jgi:GNAT superfamily N-acetyltransferase
MNTYFLVSRFAAYYSRHGFGATIRRLSEEMRRVSLNHHHVVFYCDLSKQTTSPVKLPSSLKVERLKSYAELSIKDLEEITSFGDSKQTHRNILDRFEQGASLWLIWSGDMLAAYSWTVRGHAIEPYYFPLAPNDVRLFDFLTFPKFRGRAILWFLLTHILHTLRGEGAARVFGAVEEWNQASLSLYKMTPFQRLGLVRMYKVFGYTLIRWVDRKTRQQVQKEAERRNREPGDCNRSPEPSRSVIDQNGHLVDGNSLR